MSEFDVEWSSHVGVLAPTVDSSEAFDVAVVLTTGKGTETHLSWRVSGGSVTAVPEVNADADVVLTVSPADAAEIVQGRLPIAVAYMQGRLKPAGDNALWLRLAKWSCTREFDQWRTRVLAYMRR